MSNVIQTFATLAEVSLAVVLLLAGLATAAFSGLLAGGASTLTIFLIAVKNMRTNTEGTDSVDN